MKSTFIPTIQREKLTRVNTVIIGAGPAGLSAATTLKENGRSILLLEKESVVGGKVL